MTASVVIGVDVGGTFTDLALRDQATGHSAVAKVPTTPSAPERGVLNAIDVATGGAGLADCRYLMHGTTVGLNALLERRGATVGLITTRGFRDILELRRADRGDPYDLFWRPVPPLVPRQLRLEVVERVAASGELLTDVATEDVAAALEAFREGGVDAIAVCLINAWANPANELAVAAALAELGWTGDLSLSHQVSGEYREYERTSTTVVDAFVRHRMGPYLNRLADGLAERGFAGELLVTRSGGGALTLAEARRRPFETIMSGPVAGATALAALAGRTGDRLLVGADVGGTSFDTVLVEDGRLPVLYTGEIAGLPLQTPWVDVQSIGAGGGSIAHVDAGGLLRVGPHSAGAEPGPACYGRGGERPTVVDAAVVLGMLRTGDLSGGVRIDPDAARTAVDTLTEQVGLADAEAVSGGILRIAAAHMAGAMRGITVDRGVDPRDAALVAFGGAGPLFGCLIAAELEIGRVIVPRNAGNFSAVGLLTSELSRSASRTFTATLHATALAEARALAAELLEGLDPVQQASVEVSLDLRYSGQEHTMTRVLAPAWDLAAVVDDFTAGYERVYGHRLTEELEVVTVRVTTRLPLAETGRIDLAEPIPEVADVPWPLWSFALGRRVTGRILARESLKAGPVPGPLVVVEATTTTYVDDGWLAGIDEHGHLVLDRQAES